MVMSRGKEGRAHDGRHNEFRTKSRNRRHGDETLNTLGCGHVQHGLRGHSELHQAWSAAGIVGRTSRRANHSGASAGVRDALGDPDCDDLRVPHPEAGAQPLGEHRCSGNHHRVRSRRRVAESSLRVLRDRRNRVHGADRLVRLDAAQLRIRLRKGGMALNDYPINVRADYPERSSRGWAALTILLVKFLALIPHFLLLIFLGIAQFFVALVAQVAVAISGEYPAGMFAFVTGVLRWSTRVAAFVLSLSDRYPPFTLQPVDDYPVDVVARRPAQSSRLYALFTLIVELVFIAAIIALAVHFARNTGGGASTGRGYNFSSNAGTGLLLRQIAALPHIIVLFFLGIAVFVLWVVAQWVILFSARFPRGMFGFVAGFVRWQTRVNGYALGRSDRYPPFTLEAPIKAPEPPLPSAPLPPAQWYADPSGRHTHRYWDGTQWTPNVADDGRTASDPLDGHGSGPPG